MFRDDDSALRQLVDDASGRKVVAAFERYLETIPERQALRPRRSSTTCATWSGKSGLRHRQRRAAGVQPARRGLQPGARQRRGAVDEAGQRPRGQPVRRHRGRRRLLRPRGPPHRGQPARAAGAHRPAARPHRRSTASGYVVSEVSPYEVDLDWSGLTEPDEIARRRRPARPGDRQDPLRLRRGQRPGPRRLPGRGGDRRQRRGPPRASSSAGSPTSGSTTPSGCATTTRCFVDAFREGRIGVSADLR